MPLMMGENVLKVVHFLANITFQMNFFGKNYLISGLKRNGLVPKKNVMVPKGK